MDVIRSPEGLRSLPRGVLVPTMGALHEGHLSLIRGARTLGEPVIVTIFVNPTQFDDPGDLERYPRDLEEDVARADSAGAAIVFAPSVEVVYPPGDPPPVPPLPPAATEPGLEDAHRPGHFSGVCQVVARLFDLTRPRAAVFGEKDFQQLRVITQMVAAQSHQQPDRWTDLAIHAMPTVREPDGLAMSSRNARLDVGARDRALGLVRALQSAHAAQHPRSAERLMIETLEAHNLAVDYAVVRDARDLMPISDFAVPSRALIAARVGNVRLIDNMAMTIWS